MGAMDRGCDDDDNDDDTSTSQLHDQALLGVPDDASASQLHDQALLGVHHGGFGGAQTKGSRVERRHPISRQEGAEARRQSFGKTPLHIPPAGMEAVVAVLAATLKWRHNCISTHIRAKHTVRLPADPVGSTPRWRFRLLLR